MDEGSPPAASALPDESGTSPGSVHDLATQRLMRAVRERFALAPARFAARVRALARAAGCEEAALGPYAARLALDDLYLATACLAGEDAAWRELGAAHFGFMRDFAKRYLPAAEARELADEVIAEIWERGKLASYGGRSTLRTWLGTVVAHAALNARPALERMRPLAPEAAAQPPDATVPDAADQERATLIARLLGDALRGLPAAERLMLQLYYEQRMTLDELEPILGASAPAISRRLKQSRESLRAAMEAEARRVCGESTQELHAGLDLGAIEIDLDKLLAPPLSNHRDPR
jgi:RNA polymerase sigma factor (sigma-70 family)